MAEGRVDDIHPYDQNLRGGAASYVKADGTWSPWDGSTKNKVWDPVGLAWVSMTQPDGGGGGGLVDSVNGQTGVVVLDADDISDAATTNKFVTAADKTNLSNLSGTNTGDQTLPIKATGAEINTGTDDAKFATAKAITDSNVAFLSDIPAAPTDATITTTDVITNDASTSKHGWFPKLPTAAGKFLKDDLTWATIAGGGDMLGSNNLSDVANAATALANIGGTAIDKTGVTGILKGNGTTIGAATQNTDYLPVASPTATGTATVANLVSSGTVVSGKQTHSATHTSTGAITITAKLIEVSTDGDGDVDFLALPAGSDGQEVNIFVKSCGAVADSFTVNATFVDGSTSYAFGTNPKGKGMTLRYSTTATAGWAIVAMNNVVNDRNTNASTATQAPGTARAYITASRLVAPPTGFKIGSIMRWTINMSKTAASTAAAVIDVNFGTNGSTADTARCSWTGAAQTAAVEAGTLIITAHVRGPISASCIVAVDFMWQGTLTQTTGFSLPRSKYVASSAFDITTAGIGAGVCVTGGTGSVWTINTCVAEYITI